MNKPIQNPPKKKRTRAERKAAQREYWKQHPILSGVVPIVQYTPPK